MTPQERDLLSQFLSDLLNTQVGQKDPDAAGMIDNALRARPDAAYALVQHAILADQSLHQATAQIGALQNQLQAAQAQLQAQAQVPAQPASFLGGGVVPPTPGPWGSAPQQQAYPQQAYPQQAYGQAQPQPVFGGGGGLFGGGLGSFMRTAGTMAAGVAAGDVLASGLEGLFGGHRGGFGGGFGGGGETIVNNYYDDSSDNGGGDDSGGGDWGGGDDNS